MKDNSKKFLRNLSEPEENTDRQSNKIRKTTHEQNKKFNRVTENIVENQTEILELKNTINEMKDVIKSINIRMDQAKEKNL